MIKRNCKILEKLAVRLVKKLSRIDEGKTKQLKIEFGQRNQILA